MKFTPIIHNLQPDDPGYAACQLYNNLIASRPTGPGLLASKLAKLRAWENLCKQALVAAKIAIAEKGN